MMENHVPAFKCFCPEVSHQGKASHLAMSNGKGQRCTVVSGAWQEKNQKYWWLDKILVYHIYYSHFINE